mmetsp:Transcript_2020/g.3988  ORF Transcript_2020/g.3988 Transcript_2020/m.3988 type:complete len:218 (+) Transcript_2020:928-1581(+)
MANSPLAAVNCAPISASEIFAFACRLSRMGDVCVSIEAEDLPAPCEAEDLPVPCCPEISSDSPLPLQELDFGKPAWLPTDNGDPSDNRPGDEGPSPSGVGSYRPSLYSHGWWKKLLYVMRSSGSPCRSRSSRSLHEGSRSSAGGGKHSPCSTFRCRSSSVSPRNGGSPKSISYSTAPADQRSTFALYLCLLRISGAMYTGDPHSVLARSIFCGSTAK